MTGPKRRDTRVQRVALPNVFTRHAIADDANNIRMESLYRLHHSATRQLVLSVG